MLDFVWYSGMRGGDEQRGCCEVWLGVNRRDASSSVPCRYKMAEHFGDTETMAKILDAPTTIKAEEAMKEIKDFDEAKWNEASLIFIEERIYFSRSDIPVVE